MTNLILKFIIKIRSGNIIYLISEEGSMENKEISQCPVCGNDLQITSFKCFQCQTTINGNFSLSKFSRLSEEQLHFIEVFIKSRGNIKEVEREMSISYPTVRNKLDEIISTLGYRVKDDYNEDSGKKRKEILDMLEKGEISPDEATDLLQKI